MPYDNSTQKDYGDNPLQKRSGFKMKGFSGFGNSPMEKKEDENTAEDTKNATIKQTLLADEMMENKFKKDKTYKR